MKAFGYCRCSGLSQVDGDSFPRQRAAIEEYAQRNGIEIVEWFEERGVSGTKDLDDRPALGTLMAALEANGVRTIVIEKLDRLARDLLVQESIVGDLLRKGYTLLSAAEPDLCSMEPARVFIRQVFGALAQLDRATLTAKMAAAKLRKRANDPGWREGRKPYGVFPGEDATLAWMKRIRAEGRTFKEVAESLAEK